MVKQRRDHEPVPVLNDNIILTNNSFDKIWLYDSICCLCAFFNKICFISHGNHHIECPFIHLTQLPSVFIIQLTVILSWIKSNGALNIKTFPCLLNNFYFIPLLVLKVREFFQFAGLVVGLAAVVGVVALATTPLGGRRRKKEKEWMGSWLVPTIPAQLTHNRLPLNYQFLPSWWPFFNTDGTREHKKNVTLYVQDGVYLKNFNMKFFEDF